jgi:secondary thiamine-phosphate synthase enzyme
MVWILMRGSLKSAWNLKEKSASMGSMEELLVHTKEEKQVVDITNEVHSLVKERGSIDGVCHLFLLHTSAALTTADLDNGTDLDMLDAFEHMAPDLDYRHPHNPKHAKYHILSSLIGPSLAVSIEKGELVLGPWQKIVLIEFGGPRERTIAVNFAF